LSLHKPVSSGQRLQIPAGDWNAIIEAARSYFEKKVSSEAEAVTRSVPNGVMLVKNTTGSAVPQFGVLSVDDALIDPEANANGFRARPAAIGIKPAAEYEARTGIALEPIADGAIGKVMFSGVTVAFVSAPNEYAEDYEYATILHDETGYLVASGHHGFAQILWRSPGTGEKLAIVQIGQLVSRPYVWAKLQAPDGEPPNVRHHWTEYIWNQTGNDAGEWVEKADGYASTTHGMAFPLNGNAGYIPDGVVPLMRHGGLWIIAQEAATFPVKLSHNGDGAAGDATTLDSSTYTVSYLNGIPIPFADSVPRDRPYGVIVPSSGVGIGCWADGEFILLNAYEKQANYICEADGGE